MPTRPGASPGWWMCSTMTGSSWSSPPRRSRRRCSRRATTAPSSSAPSAGSTRCSPPHTCKAREGGPVEKFRAYRLTELDKKVRGEFVECTLEQLDPGDVVVRVAYSDVNYKDALAATGRGRILRRQSCIGGIDFSGTVVSSSDARFAKGDAVLAVGFDLGVAHHGGYAQYARVPGDWLTKLPQGMSLWDAMAFGTAGFTAGIGIVRMEHNGLKPASGPVIVNGATGGVGSIAVAALSRLGYRVVALTGKGGEADWL